MALVVTAAKVEHLAWSREAVILSFSCGVYRLRFGAKIAMNWVCVSFFQFQRVTPPPLSLSLPQDKKPVGIVCLPDYESCHKAEAKIWKKQHSFMLDRGNVSQDVVHTYVHCSYGQILLEQTKPLAGQAFQKILFYNRHH